MGRRRRNLIGPMSLGFAVLGGGPAMAQQQQAQALDLGYVVMAGGLAVLEIDARLELGPRGYRLRTALRTRGMAAVFVRGEQTAQVEGRLRGAEPLPGVYRAEGVWRGQPRRLEMDYAAGAEPVLRALVAPGEPEREAVPAELRRGTLDGLSALVKLSRTVAETGRCDGAAPVYDGRRRVDYAVRTQGREVVPAWRDAWSGEALRCGFEIRMRAGFVREQDRAEAARPREGVAWVASVRPGAPPVPVRVELPSPWFGAMQAHLVRVGPAAP